MAKKAGLLTCKKFSIAFPSIIESGVFVKM